MANFNDVYKKVIRTGYAYYNLETHELEEFVDGNEIDLYSETVEAWDSEEVFIGLFKYYINSVCEYIYRDGSIWIYVEKYKNKLNFKLIR
jgi:hypothetical protein